MSTTEHLRVVHGGPTAEELAALTAVLSVTGRRTSAPPPTAAGNWHDPAAGFRTRWPAQRPGAWRASAR